MAAPQEMQSSLEDDEVASMLADTAVESRLIDVEAYTESQKRAAQRVLDILDSAERRVEAQYSTRRRH